MKQKRKSKPVSYPALPPLGNSRIWSFDLGRRTGWMLRGPDDFEISGVHELYDADGARQTFQDGERFRAFTGFLDKLEAQHQQPDVIAFEDVHPKTHKSARQTQLYQGFRAVLMQWCAIRGITCVPLSIGTIKLAATGNGNAPKEQVIEAMRARGHLPYDDNEADAIACSYALTHLHLSGEIPLDAAASVLYKEHGGPQTVSASEKKDEQDTCAARSEGARHRARPRARRSEAVAGGQRRTSRIRDGQRS